MKAVQKFKVSKGFRIAPVLSIIFNKSISEVLFSKNWKVTGVVPIYKDRPTPCIYLRNFNHCTEQCKSKIFGENMVWLRVWLVKLGLLGTE